MKKVKFELTTTELMIVRFALGMHAKSRQSDERVQQLLKKLKEISISAFNPERKTTVKIIEE